MAIEFYTTLDLCIFYPYQSDALFFCFSVVNGRLPEVGRIMSARMVSNFHSRNGSFGIGNSTAVYTPLSEERLSVAFPGAENCDSVESVIDLNAAESLIKLDDIPFALRETKSLLYDSVYPVENGGDTYLKIDTPDSQVESSRGSHSRQSSTSSISDFRQSSKTYPEEKGKTLISFAFLLLGLFCTTLALATVHDRLPDGPPLPDVVFSFVPQWDFGLAMSEYLLMLCIYPTVILISFHRHR